MNKAHLAINENSIRSIRQLSTAVREIDWPATEGTPVSELVCPGPPVTRESAGLR